MGTPVAQSPGAPPPIFAAMTRAALLVGSIALVAFAGSARAQTEVEEPILAADLTAPLAVAPTAALAPSVRFDRPLDPARAPAYYVVQRDAPVRESPNASARSSDRLTFRTTVRVLATEGDWSLISYGRSHGYVANEALSNVWLRVDKSERAVYVYRGTELLRVLPADGAMSDEDKTQRSRRGVHEEYRTPEGTYFVARRNPNSQYHLAFVLNYPNSHDALEGARAGLISDAQYEAIVRAEEEGLMPPQGTALGGLIEIHGHGSGRQRAWTRGCVALRNVHMDWLWEFVQVGTPVIVER
jgi:hypothetical protein